MPLALELFAWPHPFVCALVPSVSGGLGGRLAHGRPNFAFLAQIASLRLVVRLGVGSEVYTIALHERDWHRTQRGVKSPLNTHTPLLRQQTWLAHWRPY